MPAVLLGVGILVLLMALTSAGAARGSSYWAQALTGWLAHSLKGIPILGHIAADAVESAGRWVSNSLAAAFYSAERPVVAWFSGLNDWVKFVIVGPLYLPWELLRLQRWLVGTAIPDAVKARGVPAKLVTNLWQYVHRVEREALAHARAAEAAAVRRAHALVAGLAHELPVPFGRTLAQIRARLRRLERITAGGLAVAAVVTALARLGLGWVKCRNVGNVGRALCRTNAGWLENALLGLVAIFGTLSLVDLAKLTQGITGELVADTRHFWRADVAPAARQRAFGSP